MGRRPYLKVEGCFSNSFIQRVLVLANTRDRFLCWENTALWETNGVPDYHKVGRLAAGGLKVPL